MQTPKASFEEITERFTSSLPPNGATSTNLGVKGILSSKSIVFMTTGLLMLSAFILFSLKSNTPKESTISFQIIMADSTDIEMEKPIQKTTIPSIKKQVNKVSNSTDFQSKQIISNTNTEESVNSVDSLEQMEELKNETPTIQLKNPEIIFNDSLISLPKPQNFVKEFADIIMVDSIPVLFTITELTTETELYRISKLAKEAGIKYHYQVHSQRKQRGKELFLIRDLNIKMNIPGTDIAKQIKLKVSKNGKFKIIFGWAENENGKAISLIKKMEPFRLTPKIVN